MTATHIDLNKNPELAKNKHGFFFCPKCNNIAETTKKACGADGCEVESVIMIMGCEKCEIFATPTHWEIH